MWVMQKSMTDTCRFEWRRFHIGFGLIWDGAHGIGAILGGAGRRRLARLARNSTPHPKTHPPIHQATHLCHRLLHRIQGAAERRHQQLRAELVGALCLGVC